MSEVKVNEAIISEIRPLQLSKASAEGHAEVLAELVKSGEVNALDMATRLRYIMDVCEQACKLIQPDCVAEAEKYDKKEKIVFNNAKIQPTETGVKYDYESSGDTEWVESAANEKVYAAQRKAREEFLKKLTKPITIVSEETGEVKVINPPARTSSRSVKITFEQ